MLEEDLIGQKGEVAYMSIFFIFLVAGLVELGQGIPELLKCTKY